MFFSLNRLGCKAGARVVRKEKFVSVRCRHRQLSDWLVRAGERCQQLQKPVWQRSIKLAGGKWFHTFLQQACCNSAERKMSLPRQKVFLSATRRLAETEVDRNGSYWTERPSGYEVALEFQNVERLPKKKYSISRLSRQFWYFKMFDYFSQRKWRECLKQSYFYSL